jgi:pimeloyl-ACP methyl ester carboxylesterase/DNA-binding CsgD family transcriptional regulator
MEQQIRFCTTSDGVQIAYATAGKGPPLVKAANWLSHLEFEWQSPVWRHWLEGLSKSHTLIRYDQRGCGLSDWDVNDFSYEACVRDLKAVVDETGLDRFPLLGVSQGGSVAIAYAVHHPEKVSHLILYGSYVRGSLVRKSSKRQHEQEQTLIRLVKLGWGQENPAFRQVFTSLFIPEGTLEQFGWFNDLQHISASPANAERVLKAYGSIDVRDLARKVEVPTLVLHAKDDAKVPFEEGRLIAGLIRHARFIPLDSRNHILLEHEPAWERFLTEVRNFIDLDASELVAFQQTFADLTEREVEVLELIAQGLNNTQIAESLGISPKTVRNYSSNIYGKLQVGDRSQAIVLARGAGLGHSQTTWDTSPT